MKLAIENKKNQIGFFKIDGRHLNKFINLAEKANKDIREIWSYTGKKGNGQITQFVGIKRIKQYNK